MRYTQTHSDMKQRKVGIVSGLEEVSDWKTVWRMHPGRSSILELGRSLGGCKHIAMQEVDLPERWWFMHLNLAIYMHTM